MDQDPGTAGEKLTDADSSPAEAAPSAPEAPAGSERTPEQVKAEIEQTRAELGDTVAALAEKTDVKGQAKRAATEAKDTIAAKVAEVKHTASDKKDEFVASAQEATPGSAAQAGDRVASFARDHRRELIALGLFALGLLIGRGSKR